MAGLVKPGGRLGAKSDLNAKCVLYLSAVRCRNGGFADGCSHVPESWVCMGGCSCSDIDGIFTRVELRRGSNDFRVLVTGYTGRG